MTGRIITQLLSCTADYLVSHAYSSCFSLYLWFLLAFQKFLLPYSQLFLFTARCCHGRQFVIDIRKLAVTIVLVYWPVWFFSTLYHFLDPFCCFLCRSPWHSPSLWHGWQRWGNLPTSSCLWQFVCHCDIKWQIVIGRQRRLLKKKISHRH